MHDSTSRCIHRNGTGATHQEASAIYIQSISRIFQRPLYLSLSTWLQCSAKPRANVAKDCLIKTRAAQVNMNLVSLLVILVVVLGVTHAKVRGGPRGVMSVKEQDERRHLQLPWYDAVRSCQIVCFTTCRIAPQILITSLQHSFI